jgi:hydroxybutyrate-dimer hydrolase
MRLPLLAPLRAAALLAAAAATLAARGSKDDDVDVKPAFVGDVLHQTYDGAADDLLTAGLGATGLASAVPPAFADAAHPTVAELRRRAIYNNYRALVDVAPAGGYGTFYGPAVDVSGNATLGEGKVAGDEYLAFADDGSGRRNVAMMVQVPASFDRTRPCIVTGTSSGSRGVYGAIATAGEWGLKHGCAVAYTDKGTGTGAHDLASDTVNLLSGERADASTAGKASHFTAPLSPEARAAFLARDPDRVAFKHAHSRQNPEEDWGRDTLDAVRFAFWVLNEQLGDAAARGHGNRRTFRPGNTLVIASSVSNGGGAALAAAEADGEGLISGVVAGEPQIQVRPDARRRIVRGGVEVAGNGRPLLDYTTRANLLQPCAAYAAANAASPGLALVPKALATNRCAALRKAGVLTADAFAAQADEALALLHAAGWEPDSDAIHASHYALATVPVAVTYASAYGRFGVEETVCGFSFAPTDPAPASPTFGKPVAAAPGAFAGIFASSNGIPPTSGVNIVQDRALNGPILDALAVSRTSGSADLDADGALCLRALADGEAASGATADDAERVQAGIAEVLRHARLRGKPAILVQGRSDALVPVNHASRAFIAQNHLAEGARSQARYLEVTNAQHFDAFIDNPVLPGYDARFVPLHRYFIEAMDLMYAHLRDGAPLPDSQVVRTTPRGGPPGAAPALTAANVPPVPTTVAAGDRIVFDGDALVIPQ